MKHRSISTLMVAALCSAALAGCNNDVTPLTLDDATIANDVAATTGDAMATHMETMLGNQTSGTFAGLMAGDPIPMSNATTVNPRGLGLWGVRGTTL